MSESQPFDMLTHYTTIDGTVLYRNHAKYHEDILNFEVFDDDVWLASFIKSGTTWTQEMVWLIMNDLDFSTSLEISLDIRFPFLELSAVHPILNLSRIPEDFSPIALLKDSVDFLKRMERPRFIKTHLPWNLLPSQIQDGRREPKMIYVLRNPKDTCVSYFHHARIIDGYSGTLEEFCELFLTDKLHYCPYWANVLPFWGRRNQDNVLVIKYEDMKADLPAVINRVADFLGKSLTEGGVDKLVRHLSFDAMKTNGSVNKSDSLELLRKYIATFEGDFIRCGEVGSHKSEMSEAMARRFDEWIEEKSAGSGLKFRFQSVMNYLKCGEEPPCAGLSELRCTTCKWISVRIIENPRRRRARFKRAKANCSPNAIMIHNFGKLRVLFAQEMNSAVLIRKFSSSFI